MRTATPARLVLLATLIAGVPAAATTAQADAPAAPAAKATCSAEKKALQRAPANRKPKARKRYRACQERVLGTAIRAQLADRRLVGRRGDGEAVNWLFCANGRYRLESSGRSGRGIKNGSRWVVTQAQGSATRWTAVIRETANLRAAGLDIGVARSGSQYFVGISRGAEVTSQGPVTLSADAAACAAL